MRGTPVVAFVSFCFMWCKPVNVMHSATAFPSTKCMSVFKYCSM